MIDGPIHKLSIYLAMWYVFEIVNLILFYLHINYLRLRHGLVILVIMLCGM